MDDILELGNLVKTSADALKGIRELWNSRQGKGDSDDFATGLNTKLLEMQEIIVDTQSRTIAAQQAYFALAENERRLSEEISKSEDWNQEKDRYELRKVGHLAFAYRLREEYVKNSEPLHHICANCYHNQEKAILQYDGEQILKSILKCPRCEAEVMYNTELVR